MCLQNLRRRKSRTFLTVLGVIIGCCSIVIMVSLGIGMKESQEKMLKEMGDLTIITVTAPQSGHGKKKLDDSLTDTIKRIPGVTAVTPKLTFDGFTFRLLAGTGNRYTADWASISALNPSEMDKMGYSLKEGHGIQKSGDILAGQNLAYNFKDTLRPEGMNTIDRWSGNVQEDGSMSNVPSPYFNAAKEKITLEVDTGNGKFQVPLNPTGIVKEDYSKGPETSDGLIMSIDDLKKIIEKAQGKTKKAIAYNSVLVKVQDISKVESTENAIKQLGYTTESMESIRKPMEKEARQKQMMLGGLGAISLFVAALGITNTMIMSISERTREIGIMKALGCYVRDIRMSFLAEAGAIGLIGGISGCILSFIISVIINIVSLGSFTAENLYAAVFGGNGISRVSVIPPWLLLFAIIFSVIIGLGSGYYPANKAVQISALEAIKASE